jgi:hypothetical protein
VKEDYSWVRQTWLWKKYFMKKEKEFSAYILHALLGRCAEALGACSEILYARALDRQDAIDSIEHLVDEINKAIGK